MVFNFHDKDEDISLKETKEEIKVSRITRYVFPYIIQYHLLLH